VQLKDPIVTNR